MWLTIDVDERLYGNARDLLPAALTDVAVIEEVLKVFVRSPADKGRADIGGTSPDAENTPHKKPGAGCSESTLSDANGMRIEQIIVTGIELCGGDYKAAAKWITTSLGVLGGRRPIEMIGEEDFCLLNDLIGRLEHGIVT